MDFTLKTYQSFLSALKQAGYTLQTFEEFLSLPADGKMVVLRHDIDKRPKNALQLAQMEDVSGVKASYYIRVVKGTWDEEIIKQIVALVHGLYLKNEGFESSSTMFHGNKHRQVYNSGDVMYDNSMYFATIADKKSNING